MPNQKHHLVQLINNVIEFRTRLLEGSERKTRLVRHRNPVTRMQEEFKENCRSEGAFFDISEC